MLRVPFRPLTLAVAAAAGLALATVPGQAQSPSHLEVAREVLVGSGISRSFDAIAPQFAEQVRQTFAATRPEITKDLDEVLKALKPELDKQRDDLTAATARLFAARLSEAELREIAKFFASPAGKRYVEVQPVVLDGMFNEMQAWSQRLSEFIVTRVREEMKKKGHTL